MRAVYDANFVSQRTDLGRKHVLPPLISTMRYVGTDPKPHVRWLQLSLLSALWLLDTLVGAPTTVRRRPLHNSLRFRKCVSPILIPIQLDTATRTPRAPSHSQLSSVLQARSAVPLDQPPELVSRFRCQPLKSPSAASPPLSLEIARRPLHTSPASPEPSLDLVGWLALPETRFSDFYMRTELTRHARSG
jgi:hypothetical protein